MRYLYIFSPLYIVLAGSGLGEVNCSLHELRKRIMNKDKNGNKRYSE